jgi:ATP-dependent DNA helicase RecG
MGPYSLIEDKVKFKKLSLVVDEQHRFGVMQKFAALDKAQFPDILDDNDLIPQELLR